MAKDTKTEPARGKSTPSGGGHKTSGGSRTRSRKSRELRSCRKTIRHMLKRNRTERSDRVVAHMGYVQKGEGAPSDGGKRQRRVQAQQRALAAMEIAMDQRFRKKNPGLAQDIDHLNNHPAIKAERAR